MMIHRTLENKFPGEVLHPFKIADTDRVNVLSVCEIVRYSYNPKRLQPDGGIVHAAERTTAEMKQGKCLKVHVGKRPKPNYG